MIANVKAINHSSNTCIFKVREKTQVLIKIYKPAAFVCTGTVLSFSLLLYIYQTVLFPV